MCTGGRGTGGTLFSFPRHTALRGMEVVCVGIWEDAMRWRNKENQERGEKRSGVADENKNAPSLCRNLHCVCHAIWHLHAAFSGEESHGLAPFQSGLKGSCVWRMNVINVCLL